MLVYLITAICGVLLGNYLTTAYYRIPRGKPINGLSKNIGIKPHCSTCAHPLKYYEYFPVLSWFSTRFKCNYCGAPTDMTYFTLEFGMMLFALIIVAALGMSDFAVLLIMFVAAVYLAMMLLYKYKKLYFKSSAFVVVSAFVLILYCYVL